MTRTYSYYNKIYSVDMMIAYINIFKPKSINVDTKKLYESLEYNGWGDPIKNIYYSPLDVIKNQKNKKYKDDVKRIKEADMKYPIILCGDNIVDGMHRLSKAYLSKQKKIKAYLFTKKDMNKFLINKTNNWKKVSKIEIYDFIKLFHERFYK